MCKAAASLHPAYVLGLVTLSMCFNSSHAPGGRFVIVSTAGGSSLEDVGESDVCGIFPCVSGCALQMWFSGRVCLYILHLFFPPC